MPAFIFSGRGILHAGYRKINFLGKAGISNSPDLPKSQFRVQELLIPTTPTLENVVFGSRSFGIVDGGRGED